jgi:outer membrane lipoprotein LolB
MPSISRLLCAGRRAGLFLGVLLLAGCAAQRIAPDAGLPTRDALSAFTLEGRFSLRHDDKNYSGRLSWRHQGANNAMMLSSPFGQGIAEITTSERGAQLTSSDGKKYSAVDVETLTMQVLGYPLPLAHLTDWVRGRGARSAASEVDTLGRLRHLRHDDWRIDYDYASEAAQAPPSALFARRSDGLEVRLRIDEWTALTSADSMP